MAAADAGTIRAVRGMLRVIDTAVGAFTAQFLFHKTVFFCYAAVNAYTVFNGGIPMRMRTFTAAATEVAILDFVMWIPKATSRALMIIIICIKKLPSVFFWRTRT